MSSLELKFREIICENCKHCFGGYYVESVWEENDEKTFKLLHPICEKCLISRELKRNKIATPRLTPNSDVVCNLDLDWANTGIVCRDLVKNNAEGVMRHMIEKHGWRVIPELAQNECKTKEDEFAKMRLYSEDPKQWFFDNQFSFIEFKQIHFKKQIQLTQKGKCQS